MAPRIKRVYHNNNRPSLGKSPSDLSFLSIYRREQRKETGKSGAGGEEEVKRLREELKERERKMIQDLSAFKANPINWKPPKYKVKPSVFKEEEEEEYIVQVPAEDNNEFNQQLPTQSNYSFAVDSPIIRNSCILEGSFAMINDFSSSPDSIIKVPGSSRITSPTRTFRTSERTSPIKLEADDSEEVKEEVKEKRKRKEPRKPKRRRKQTRRTNSKTTRTTTRTNTTTTRNTTMGSPPNSPLPNGAFSIDPEFLQNYPGIWVKRLQRPLIVSPTASPDHFFH